jgi:hypothetical protein
MLCDGRSKLKVSVEVANPVNACIQAASRARARLTETWRRADPMLRSVELHPPRDLLRGPSHRKAVLDVGTQAGGAARSSSRVACGQRGGPRCPASSFRCTGCARVRPDCAMEPDGDIAAGGGFIWTINRRGIIAQIDGSATNVRRTGTRSSLCQPPRRQPPPTAGQLEPRSEEV